MLKFVLRMWYYLFQFLPHTAHSFSSGSVMDIPGSGVRFFKPSKIIKSFESSSKRVVTLMLAVFSLAVIAAVSLAVKNSFLQYSGSSLISGYSTSNGAADSYSPQPEYRQTAELVVASLSPKTRTLDHHEPVFRGLPTYSKILFLVPQSLRGEISRQIRERDLHHSIRLIDYDEEIRENADYYLLFPEKSKLVHVPASDGPPMAGQGSIWARDLFLAAKSGSGKPRLLVPDAHKWYVSHGNAASAKVVSDNRYLNRLATAQLDLERLPLIFQGGNILVDRSDGELTIFLGSNSIQSTKLLWKSMTDWQASESNIRDVFKEQFAADRLVVVGGDMLQPLSLMFHLDQAMLLLGSKRAAVTRIVGHEKYRHLYNDELRDVESFLEQVESTLKELDYGISYLDTSVRNISMHQLPVNSIVFHNRDSGEDTILFPRYKEAASEYDDVLFNRNRETLENLGFRVVPISTALERINGGIHCLVNIVK